MLKVNVHSLLQVLLGEIETEKRERERESLIRLQTTKLIYAIDNLPEYGL